MIPASRRRLIVLYAVIGALLVALGGRLYYLQVLNGHSYVQLASQDQTQTVITPAVRGQILDDAGLPMVDNTSSLVVTVNMMNLATQSDGGAAVLRRLAHLLGMSDKLLTEKVRLCTAHVSQPCWPGSPYQPIPVAQHVPDALAVQIMQDHARYPGVSAGVNPVARYPQPNGANPAQVLGYLGPITAQQMKQQHLPTTGFAGVDLVGQAGLEAQYNQDLQGTPGQQVLSVNSAGQQLGVMKSTAPKTGNDLVTSINARLQGDVQTVLANTIRRAQQTGSPKATTGAAIVMTTTGRVVAMASAPSYNPSVWNGGISERQYRQLINGSKPILNRVTKGEYAPGSTFKVTSTAAAVRAGYSLDSTYNCPASYNIAGRSFLNDGQKNLGQMSLHEALVISCDTVFYELAYGTYQHDHPRYNVVTSAKTPIQEMQKMELGWGFGKVPGIDLPEQGAGSIPTREWLYYLWKGNAHTGQDWCKYGRANGTYVQQIEYQDCHYGNVWEPGEAAIAAIGQGYVSVTPLQLADAYVALANGGKLYSPRIGEAVISPTGQLVRKIRPKLIRRLPVAGSTLAYIRSALAGVVTQGTAASAFSGFPLNQVCVAGKTGTAQLFGKNATSVFASFAPCNHPKYVVLVMVPDSGYGADVAAPAVRAIWDDIYGLEGHKAALPGGQVPSALPRITSTGIKAPAGYA